MDAAKDVASEAQEQVQRKITEQKGLGADYVDNLADTMRRAANQFDADMPVAGTYIRKAAVQVENAADALRKGDFNDLVQGAQRFARDQPTAFFGLAFLAGFGAVRFLKSASGGSDVDGETRSPGDQGWTEPRAAGSKCERREQEIDVTPMPEERSISQLVGDSLAELAKLVQNEIDLARAELSAKVAATATRLN